MFKFNFLFTTYDNIQKCKQTLKHKTFLSVKYLFIRTHTSDDDDIFSMNFDAFI